MSRSNRHSRHKNRPAPAPTPARTAATAETPMESAVPEVRMPVAEKGHTAETRRGFRMVRYFSLSSLASVVVVATLITLLYRQVAVGAIIEFGERTNLMVAQTALISVKPRLVAYLDRVNELPVPEVVKTPLDQDVERTIHDVMDHTNVVRVLVHTRHGVVAFSTKHDQIGTREVDNPGFRSAVSGSVASRLVYRDVFNVFDPVTDEDNLIQTYVPVNDNAGNPPHGVFEIYTDVNQSVAQVQRAELVVLGGSILALLLLYGVLLFVVRRGAETIEQQQETIRERTRTLELLSARMLTAQEAEKQRLANRLHDEVGENLSAIRMLAEQAMAADGPGSPARRARILQMVQETQRDVLGMAVGLRPPSLDDLGLLKTLEALAREYATIHPQLRIDTRFSLAESQVPPSLRVIIYRMVQESLEAVGKTGAIARVRITLDADPRAIRLTLTDDRPSTASPGDDAATVEPLLLTATRERTILSGGNFQIASGNRGGCICHAVWPVATTL